MHAMMKLKETCVSMRYCNDYNNMNAVCELKMFSLRILLSLPTRRGIGHGCINLFLLCAISSVL